MDGWRDARPHYSNAISKLVLFDPYSVLFDPYSVKTA